MSVPVDLAELAQEIERFGPVAFLLTSGEDGAPHVVSVAPQWRDSELAASAGSRTGGNVTATGRAGLLWAAPPGGEYCLIVDGNARVDDGEVRVQPSRAVRHRLASADPSLPSCVTVL